METGIFHHMGPVWKHRRGSFTRDFNRWMKGALELVILSLREFYEGKLGGELLYWETPKVIPSKTLEMGVCFHRFPAFGVHERTLYSKVV
jgi:hypothetical protein